MIILAFSLLFVLPSAALGDDKQNYASTGAGFYFYTGDLPKETQLDEAFIGLEGRYLFIEKAKFSDEKVELDGFAVIAKLGFRF